MLAGHSAVHPADTTTALAAPQSRDAVTEQQSALRAKGHDVVAVVADPALVSLPDGQVLAHAVSGGSALVTANIKDFMPLDGQYRAAGQSHAGLILVSTRAFPQDRSFVGAIASALAALLDTDQIQAGPGHIPRSALTRAGCAHVRSASQRRCGGRLSAQTARPW